MRILIILDQSCAGTVAETSCRTRCASLWIPAPAMMRWVAGPKRIGVLGLDDVL